MEVSSALLNRAAEPLMGLPDSNAALFASLNNCLYSNFHLTSRYRRNFYRHACLKSGEFELENPKSELDVVNIIYIDRQGKKHHVKGKVGDNVMYLAHRYNIEIEGACEASLACSTCHVYVKDEYFDKLPEPLEK
uniref:2Fe-2S ferredoxin-type domain-containing protein n=1 Tax=Biomphalaria glabrata TaxID=6526 RepID=A0A2C9LYF6_BIOGL